MGHHGQLEFEIEDLDTDNADVVATVHTTDDEDYDKVVPPKWRDLFVAATDMLTALEAVSRLDYLNEHNALANQVKSAIRKAKGEA